MTRIDNSRTIRSPRGTECSAKSWLTEAPLRMLMNNLDPDVAEHPEELVVYGGIGRAAAAGACRDFDLNLRRDEPVGETIDITATQQDEGCDQEPVLVIHLLLTADGGVLSVIRADLGRIPLSGNCALSVGETENRTGQRKRPA